MKIIYGSPQEKHLLSAAFLLAAISSVGLLLWQQMFDFPYLWISLYLLLCGALMMSFPLSRLNDSFLWQGLFRVAPTLLFMGAIFLGSSFTTSMDHSLKISDYYLHSAEFFGLGLFTARMVYPAQKCWGYLLFFLVSLGIVIGFGGLDEIHQYHVPGREPDFRDVLWDAVGGFCGILAYTLLVSLFTRDGLRKEKNENKNPGS